MNKVLYTLKRIISLLKLTYLNKNMTTSNNNQSSEPLLKLVKIKNKTTGKEELYIESPIKDPNNRVLSPLEETGEWTFTESGRLEGIAQPKYPF